MCKSSERLIWATHGSDESDTSAKTRLVDGLARVLRSEKNSRTVITIHFEDSLDDENTWGETIASLLVTKVLGSDLGDVEYIQRDGTILISRVVEGKSLDHEIHYKNYPRLRDTTIEEAGAVSLAVTKPGLLDSLYFASDNTYLQALDKHEVEIRVENVGLNFRDLLVALGRHNDKFLGCECSGIITRVGENCKMFSAGDRVCLAKIGCMSTYVRTHSDLVFKIPDNISSPEAAGMMITASTVYYSLVEVAKLQHGESVLIHSASGATGQMAIQLAKHLGCEIFVTVGFENKKQLLMNLYGIHEDHIFYSRNMSFSTGIMRATSDRGVDVVLNSLSGDALVASWELVAPYGRFIELGKVDIVGNSKLPMSAFAKNVSFSAIAIDGIIVERPKVFRGIMLNAMELFQQGILKSVYPFQLMPISKLQEGMRLLQSGKMSGKIVFTMDATDTIPTLMLSKSHWKFDPKATYLISGGLGGLGRSAAMWMARKGAKNLILLSRSGPISGPAIELLRKLRQMGVSVEAPKCDISSARSLAVAISRCYEVLPPIKGCIQSAMVLQDALFEKMTFEEWSTSIKSKVNSTLNLHNVLPTDLSFFIMLSSIAGIGGTVGQSNYAAGNTFQDALCLHRLAHGQNASSLRLGIMDEVGIVSENDTYFQVKNKQHLVDIASIKENEFLALLDHYCDPDQAPPLRENSMPIIGLVTPAQLVSQGLDVPDWILRPTFSPLSQIGLTSTSSSSKVSSGVDFATELRHATSFADAKEVVLIALVSKLAKALAITVSDIDTNKPLHSYGVDSLLAVELRNWAGKELDANISVFDIMSAESILILTVVLTAKTSLIDLKEEI